MAEHSTLTDPDLHEPKGAAAAAEGQALFKGASSSGFREILASDISDLGLDTAVAGEVMVATGPDAAAFRPLVASDISDVDVTIPAVGSTMQGMYDYNDVATIATPIPLTTPTIPYQLTNDGLGAGTLLTYGLDGLTDVWDTTTNLFEWKNGGDVLEIGDTVDMRFDITVHTTGPNTAVDLDLVLGVGSVDEIVPVFSQLNFKLGGSYRVVRVFKIYMGSADTLNFPTKVEMHADSTGASVTVGGWFITVQHKVV